MIHNNSSFWYKIKSGEAMTFNKFRLFHARSAYDQEKYIHGKWVQLACVDLNCVHSKIQLLAKKHGIPSPV